MLFINQSVLVFMVKYTEQSIIMIKNNMLLKLFPFLSSDKIKNFNNVPLTKLIFSPILKLINILSGILICSKPPIISISSISIAMEEPYKDYFLDKVNYPNSLRFSSLNNCSKPFKFLTNIISCIETLNLIIYSSITESLS